MSSEHYHAGRGMEENTDLHAILKEQLEFDSIDVDGSTLTKGDVFGIKGDTKTPISVKFASPKNTQVHLTTLNKFAELLKMPAENRAVFEKFLGVKNTEIFKSWTGYTLDAYEKSHQRIKGNKIAGWEETVAWVNSVKPQLTKMLIQSIGDEDNVKYLVWIQKKTRVLQIVDVDQLVPWIIEKCVWAITPKGTVLKCATPDGRPILTLQMKGNRLAEGGYNHDPQFQIYPYWPEEFVLHKTVLI